MSLAERELKTLFLYGSGNVQAAEAVYAPSEPVSGASRVRVFNATGSTVTARLDEGLVLAPDVAPGTVSSYTAVNAVAGRDQMADIERAMYGLDTGAAPVSWSSDGRYFAYVGAPDGQLDVYLADLEGPPRRLSNDTNSEMAPVWSPNGEGLAWTALEGGFDVHHLYSYAVSGERPVEIRLQDVATAAGQLPDAGVVIPEHAGWVDDERIYFYPVVSGLSQGIWLANATTGALSQVVSEAIEQPVWSGEAGQWAYVQADVGELRAVSPDGRSTVLASGAVNGPLWSPDGSLVSWVEGESSSSAGWAIHVVNADGTGDRALTGRLPTLQASPPVPGPRVKRMWLDDGRTLAFSRAGRDYGAAERSGELGGTAGDDIENLWVVSVDGSTDDEPERITDLKKHFYFKEIAESRDGGAFAFVAFSYLDRTQKLWAVASDGGKPSELDSGVRWYLWLP
jgi:Tol biopolymer transport system component